MLECLPFDRSSRSTRGTKDMTLQIEGLTLRGRDYKFILAAGQRGGQNTEGGKKLSTFPYLEILNVYKIDIYKQCKVHVRTYINFLRGESHKHTQQHNPAASPSYSRLIKHRRNHFCHLNTHLKPPLPSPRHLPSHIHYFTHSYTNCALPLRCRSE